MTEPGKTTFTPPGSGLAALQLRDLWHLAPWVIAIGF